MHLSTAVAAVLGATAASAHGLVTKPPARQPGAATQAVCGKPMVDFYKADPTSYPEALMRNRGWNTGGYDAAKCNLWLCKGYQFADNAQQVQSYKAGDTVAFEVNIRIPHKGNANVSVVDTAANKVLGDLLLKWADGYADAAKFPNLPKDQLSFSVKVPDLGTKCATAGACVLQWYWFGQGQTYQSCVDFTQTPAAPVIRGRHPS